MNIKSDYVLFYMYLPFWLVEIYSAVSSGMEHQALFLTNASVNSESHGAFFVNIPKMRNEGILKIIAKQSEDLEKWHSQDRLSEKELEKMYSDLDWNDATQISHFVWHMKTYVHKSYEGIISGAKFAFEEKVAYSFVQSINLFYLFHKKLYQTLQNQSHPEFPILVENTTEFAQMFETYLEGSIEGCKSLISELVNLKYEQLKHYDLFKKFVEKSMQVIRIKNATLFIYFNESLAVRSKIRKDDERVEKGQAVFEKERKREYQPSGFCDFRSWFEVKGDTCNDHERKKFEAEKAEILKHLKPEATHNYNLSIELKRIYKDFHKTTFLLTVISNRLPQCEQRIEHADSELANISATIADIQSTMDELSKLQIESSLITKELNAGQGRLVSFENILDPMKKSLEFLRKMQNKAKVPFNLSINNAEMQTLDETAVLMILIKKRMVENTTLRSKNSQETA